MLPVAFGYAPLHRLEQETRDKQAEIIGCHAGEYREDRTTRRRSASELDVVPESISVGAAGDFERAVCQSKRRHDPAPAFDRNPEFVRDSLTGHRNADPIHVGDDRQDNQTRQDPISNSVLQWLPLVDRVSDDLNPYKNPLPIKPETQNSHKTDHHQGLFNHWRTTRTKDIEQVIVNMAFQ